MTRGTRRIIFYLFVVIFIILTPPTILYSVGYSYDFQKQAFVQMGGIYLKSSPSDAQILINGKDSSVTPRLISRLSPKIYNVSVVKDGFYPWQKNLEVSPTIVTEARNIFLFPKKIVPELVSTDATSTIQDFLMAPEEKKNLLQAQKIASSTAGWLWQNNSILFLSETDFILYQENLNGSGKSQISKEALSPAKYKIFTNDSRRFLALSAIGELYYLDAGNGIFEPIAKGIKNAVFSGDNKKFVYWADNEIWVSYIEDLLIQPYKKAGDKELITRYAQKISQAIFYPDNEHIAFVVGEQIKVIELDGRDQRNTVDLVRAPNPQIYFDQKNGYLYYLTETSIFKLKIEY
ncbi:PEGA domain-containing protein [Patescibacteria group bacterium]|nr:PEGA domain-containing protein [Patescibacteria group bacterium]